MGGEEVENEEDLDSPNGTAERRGQKQRQDSGKEGHWVDIVGLSR